MNRSSSRRECRINFSSQIACLTIFLALSETCSAQIWNDVTIVMSDGVVLEATIVRPLGLPPSGGFPGIVLVHGFGGNKDQMLPIALAMAVYGYASIAYSVRGQGNSGGLSSVSGPREIHDLLGVIQYFRNAQWINPNKIGVTGGSQGGIHSWMAAIHQMPGVRAVAPLIATPDFARALVPRGCVTYGLPRELTLSSVRYTTDRDRARDFIIADEYDSLLVFIDERDLGRFVDSVRIPVFQGLGWADFLFPVNGGIAARSNLAARGVPIWSYFGTNGHGEPVDTIQAALVLQKTIQWFDHWIRGFSLDGDSIPIVFYADDRPGWPWHTTPSWPPQPNNLLRLYVSGGELRTSPPFTAESYQFSLAYDSSYTPEMAWNDLYGGGQFMAAFTSSPVRFLSEPLQTDIEVTGIPVGRIFVQGDAPKFQAHVRFYDVVGTGTGFDWRFVSRTINGIRQNTPGQIHELDVEGRALSHIVSAGNRIGIEVTSFDLLHADRANTIPYFVSSSSLLLTSPSSPSYVDIPVVGSIPVAVSVEGRIPASYVLEQNYPNPFNPTTKIPFMLPKESIVTLKIYNVLGQEVTTLVNEPRLPGYFVEDWDATNSFGNKVSSGVYFYRMEARETTGSVIFTNVKRMILLK
ncbi:MAG: T9SS type A sorting domain-containing protein [Ignavibacteriae bacterium]|nr:T9SS type A sorting domain-containing protein [Ignavibacteriota bacterium]